MTTRSKKYGLSLLGILVGFGTITLFQNCSSGGGLPVDTQVSSSTAPVTYPNLFASIYPNPVVSGQTAIVSITGGNSNFNLPTSTCGGVVSKNPDGSWAFAAPSSVTTTTQCLILVTDTSGKSAQASFSVAPPPVTAPVTPTITAPPSKQIYVTTNIGLMFTPMYTDDQNQFPNLPGIAHHFLATNSSAGAIPLYRCTVATGFAQDWGTPEYYVDSTQANCEGRTQTKPRVLLGYIYPDSSMANTQALYRYSKIGNLQGFQWIEYHETFSRDEATASERSDGVIGYVPVN